MSLNYTSEIPFLGLNIAELENIDQLKFRKNQVIFCEGNTCLGAYFVKQGKVKLIRPGSGGKEQIIRIILPGEIVSSTEILLNSKYNSYAKALEDCTLLFIEKNTFRKMMAEKPKLLEQFLLLLSRDLLNAEAKITDMAYKPVKIRLAEALLKLLENYSKHDPKPGHSVLISRKDLAGLLGTAKETVNRQLSDLRKEELISTSGTKINILDVSKLKSMIDLYN